MPVGLIFCSVVLYFMLVGLTVCSILLSYFLHVGLTVCSVLLSYFVPVGFSLQCSIIIFSGLRVQRACVGRC